jgi:glycosyltransferase involved in cell wall biosynthesis
MPVPSPDDEIVRATPDAEKLPGNRPAVSVVIAARDAAATLGAVLDDLIAMTPGDRAEVIVVDDGSSDDTGAVAEARAAGIPLLRVLRTTGQGPAAARNRGVREASAPWLAFTDADVRLPRDWLDEGLVATEAGSDIVEGVVRPSGGDATGLLRHRASSDGGGKFVTANLWVHRQHFDAVAGFDEAYVAPWREDTDLGWRLIDAGATATTAPNLVAIHPYYRRQLRQLFREGRIVEGDTRLRRKFPDRARVMQPRRERRRTYASTLLLIGAAGIAGAGHRVGATAMATVGAGIAVAAVLPETAFRGTTTAGEWVALAALAPALAVARTWWIVRANVRHRTWFW